MNLSRSIAGLLVAAILPLSACGEGPSLAAPGDHGEPPAEPAEPAAAYAGLPSSCPAGLNRRAPEQVLEDLRAALAVGDVDAALCNYHVDASVIGDGGVDVGHEQIRASLEFFLQLWEGVQPQVVQQIVTELPQNRTHLVRLLFTIDTACVSVPDGVDTYVIRNGLIRGQTSHGFPVFDCFP